MATILVLLVSCLLVPRVSSITVEDNTVSKNNNPAPAATQKGYSRITVESPGMRKYRYNIAHDPEGRDFSIDFNPQEAEDAITNNYLQNEQALEAIPADYPQYLSAPEGYDHLQLKVKVPSHLEKQKSSQNIQGVYQSFSKRPVEQPQKPVQEEDFDLGLMGYGDFMDMDHHDYQPHASPRPQVQPTRSTARPILRQFYKVPQYGDKQVQYQQQVKFPYTPTKKFTFPKVQNQLQSHVKAPYTPPQKFTFPKVREQKAPLQSFPQPKHEYGFRPVNHVTAIQKPLFVPSYDEDHLHNLGTKAFSKVFMSQAHLKSVPQLYAPQQVGQGGSQDYSKTLFVPVVMLPNSGPTAIYQ